MPGPLPPVTKSANPQPGQHKILGGFTATAYCNKFGPRSINGTGVTAGGTDLRDGSQKYIIAAGTGSGLKIGDIVSIEPNPFGSGTNFKVDDHGGAIFGKHIDIYVADCAKAAQWGHRPVTVNLLPGTSGVGPSSGDKALSSPLSAISDTASALRAVVGFIGALFEASTWLRIGKVVAGGILILIGIISLLNLKLGEGAQAGASQVGRAASKGIVTKAAKAVIK